MDSLTNDNTSPSSPISGRQETLTKPMEDGDAAPFVPPGGFCHALKRQFTSSIGPTSWGQARSDLAEELEEVFTPEGVTDDAL
jgi:hypothetical protein